LLRLGIFHALFTRLFTFLGLAKILLCAQKETEMRLNKFPQKN
jgi:hypothetical protein